MLATLCETAILFSRAGEMGEKGKDEEEEEDHFGVGQAREKKKDASDRTALRARRV